MKTYDDSQLSIQLRGKYVMKCLMEWSYAPWTDSCLIRWIKVYSLGILLMARKGRNTRIVLMADRFILPTSRQYSTALENTRPNVSHPNYAIHDLSAHT